VRARDTQQLVLWNRDSPATWAVVAKHFELTAWVELFSNVVDGES
jgi:hypothetical protein